MSRQDIAGGTTPRLRSSVREPQPPGLESLPLRGRGCQMHTNDARRAQGGQERGPSAQRSRRVRGRCSLTEKEQAALALAEAVTLVADDGVPDDVYTEAATHFEERELAHVLSLILTINTWNPVALATAKVAGTDERR
ncbi:carboxymuconolactone decarboxylase family protein [Streptomyces dysideae]|uniref:hypothetical protein n=1 Tax=Streptomyces dysideae TaxID=909626 RepID=UPI00389AD49D